jgi:hypothetical protein
VVRVNREAYSLETRYKLETPAAMGRYDQCVLGSQLITMQATGRRQPWWLNESLKKCDDGNVEGPFHDIDVFGPRAIAKRMIDTHMNIV